MKISLFILVKIGDNIGHYLFGGNQRESELKIAVAHVNEPVNLVGGCRGKHLSCVSVLEM